MRRNEARSEQGHAEQLGHEERLTHTGGVVTLWRLRRLLWKGRRDVNGPLRADEGREPRRAARKEEVTVRKPLRCGEAPAAPMGIATARRELGDADGTSPTRQCELSPCPERGQIDFRQ